MFRMQRNKTKGRIFAMERCRNLECHSGRMATARANLSGLYFKQQHQSSRHGWGSRQLIMTACSTGEMQCLLTDLRKKNTHTQVQRLLSTGEVRLKRKVCCLGGDKDTLWGKMKVVYRAVRPQWLPQFTPLVRGTKQRMVSLLSSKKVA